MLSRVSDCCYIHCFGFATVVLACVIIITQVADWFRGQHLLCVPHSLAVKASIMMVIIYIVEWQCLIYIMRNCVFMNCDDGIVGNVHGC